MSVITETRSGRVGVCQSRELGRVLVTVSQSRKLGRVLVNDQGEYPSSWVGGVVGVGGVVELGLARLDGPWQERRIHAEGNDGVLLEWVLSRHC